MIQATYYVYIMTNQRNTVLYTGITHNLERRVQEHKNGEGGVFTSKYQVTKLVCYEETGRIDEAIAREKQIKGGSRKKKIELIEKTNPSWRDLSLEWGDSEIGNIKK